MPFTALQEGLYRIRIPSILSMRPHGVTILNAEFSPFDQRLKMLANNDICFSANAQCQLSVD